MRPIVLAIVFSLATTAFVRADDVAPPTTHFQKGRFDLTLETDYAHSFDISRARVEGGAIGVGYYFRDNMAINVEAAGFAIDQAGPNSIVSDFDLRIRHHVFNSGAFSFFFDFGAGVSYANHQTPASGTNFNYTLQPGVGATWQLSDKCFLIGGARYWHLSNADLEGKARNPSINAIEGYVGVMALF